MKLAMGQKLVIVESPAKAKTIGKYLGKNYVVEASMGHVRDLPKSRLGVDIENNYTPKYITIRGKGELIDKLRKAAKKEFEERKNAITEIIELTKINGFRNMLRWARITRMKKISMLRVNFSGTIGTLDGTDMDKISEKISMELGNK